MPERKWEPLKRAYQSPNYLVDIVMRFLSGNEQKCVSVLCRKTFGWQKYTDRISKSQLKEFTGLNVQTIERCMSELVKYRVVIRVSETVENHGVEWSIPIDDNDKLIDLKGLEEREIKRSQKNHNRTTNAQAKSKVGLSNEPTPTDDPPVGLSNEPHKKHYQKTSSSASSAKREKIISFYEQEIGKISPTLSEKLLTAKNIYSEEWVLDALTEAVTYNKPSWAYAETILKRWKAEGKVKTKGINHANSKNRSGSSKHQQPKLTGEALERKREEVRKSFADELSNNNYTDADRETARRIAEKRKHAGL